MANHRLMLRGIEDAGPVLDGLDGFVLATISLSTAKVVRQEHRMQYGSARKVLHVCTGTKRYSPALK